MAEDYVTERLRQIARLEFVPQQNPDQTDPFAPVMQ